MSKATVTQLVQQLEARLRVKLLNRTGAALPSSNATYVAALPQAHCGSGPEATALLELLCCFDQGADGARLGWRVPRIRDHRQYRPCPGFMQPVS